MLLIARSIAYLYDVTNAHNKWVLKRGTAASRVVSSAAAAAVSNSNKQLKNIFMAVIENLNRYNLVF